MEAVAGQGVGAGAMGTLLAPPPPPHLPRRCHSRWVPGSPGLGPMYPSPRWSEVFPLPHPVHWEPPATFNLKTRPWLPGPRTQRRPRPPSAALPTGLSFPLSTPHSHSSSFHQTSSSEGIVLPCDHHPPCVLCLHRLILTDLLSVPTRRPQPGATAALPPHGVTREHTPRPLTLQCDLGVHRAGLRPEGAGPEGTGSTGCLSLVPSRLCPLCQAQGRWQGWGWEVRGRFS